MAKPRALFFFLVFLCLSGWAQADAPVLTGKVAVVTAFEPVLRGANVGTTAFQNDDYIWDATGFDINATAVEVAGKVAARELKIVNGASVGLAQIYDPAKDQADILLPKLRDLGREWQVDSIVVLTTTDTQDTIAGTNQRLTGMGYYRREMFGAKRRQVYGVFVLRVFDCHADRFIDRENLVGAQEVPDAEWHERWEGYTSREKRYFLTGWKEITRENVGALLTKVGLANAPGAERSTLSRLIFTKDKPKSWLPEGNDLDIPPAVTKAQAAAAVVSGLKDRGWTLVSQNGDKVVGFYRDGKKEAGVTAVFNDHTITLTYEAHRISDKGVREPVELYKRWNNNLKESVFKKLVEAEDETAGNPEPVK